MPKGGRVTPGPGKRIGRPPKPKIDPLADRNAAARIIAGLEALTADRKTWETASAEIRTWANLWFSRDEREQLDTKRYLYDKRDGKAVHTVNHLHDKPIEMNLTLSLAETVQKARKRALGK